MISRNIHPVNEQELLERVAKGDQQAFSQIVQRYASLINLHLARSVRDERHAEEVAQDVFLSIWMFREKLAGIQNFPGFVYVVTKNRMYNQLKKKKAAMAVMPDEPLLEMSTAPESAIELKELHSILHKGIESLPEKRKEVFKLSRLNGLSNEEIAAMLNISRNTIREHIREALAFLRCFIPRSFEASAECIPCNQKRKAARAVA